MELTIEQKLLAIEGLSNVVNTSEYGSIKKEAEGKLMKLIKSLEVPNIIATIETPIIIATIQANPEPTQPKEPTFKIETKEELSQLLKDFYCFYIDSPAGLGIAVNNFLESKFPDPKQEPKLLNELKGKNCELQPKDLETILNEFVKAYKLDVSLDGVKHYASRIMYMFPELTESLYTKDEVAKHIMNVFNIPLNKFNTFKELIDDYIKNNIS